MSIFIDKPEIIFICTPISAYKSLFEELKKFKLSNETVITDVCSCKTAATLQAASREVNDHISIPSSCMVPLEGTR